MSGVQPDPGVPGERAVSGVAGRSGLTKTHGAIMIAGAGALAVAFVLLRPQGNRERNAGEDRLRVASVSRYEPAPPPLATPVSFPVIRPYVAPPPPPPMPATMAVLPLPAAAVPAVDPMLKARHAPLFAYSSNAGAAAPRAATEGEDGQPARLGGAQQSELAYRLQATPVRAVSATVLRNQPYLLTKGNTLPCVLQTAIDSTLPGFVTCKLPQDVIGKTGITLLDRGTMVVGETHGGMQQGQARLFVLWTRAETPNGVVINLDSPATDAIGKTGFDGDVESHFFSRLKGALLLSLVQGGLQAGSSAVSGSGFNNFNTSGLQGVSSETLRNSVDIRPTLTKNQGEIVGIMIARDLDFSTVYRVSATP